ncbi:dead box helicase [Zalerion maritima]|uniref:ATP-dependent DNA helicase n=1 Tax=Zalerion maritima TaxID=339359 RepID=A0AAD5WR40_9PEZI|nr:dead box helicase [Zalerion maritima]
MEEEDDYGSDIAEEDLLEALTQVEAPRPPPQSYARGTVNGINGSGLAGGSRTLAPSSSFRQTTLFGNAIQTDEPMSPRRNRPNYRGDRERQEPPTHHELDDEAMKRWVYPTNLGPIRDYQYTIVKSSLFNNTLVALPTGLGKTFIAAAAMLNFYRWTKDAKIIFVAPTKPLVSQQVDACFNIAGIPRSETTLLTGEISPALRAEEWGEKRVFFMTPQTLQNDLSRGIADPKSISLLVIDEAHRSTGEYAYAKVVKFIRRFNNSFRILALTATPGSSVEVVQEIIDNLGISHVEIRTEESIDIRQYVHQRNIEQVVVDPSDEMNELRDLFSKALKPLTDKLSQQNIYWGRDPMSISTFGLLKFSQEWMNGPGRHANMGLKNMIRAVFSILQGIAHSVKLLNFHGIRPFYANMKEFREEVEKAGSKGSKNKQQLVANSSFQEMMRKVELWTSRDDFISHPKISHLCDSILNHFMDHGETRESVPASGTGTRIIVFSEYRDSAEDIVKILNKHRPLVRASVFVGQADSKRSEGMNQKTQLETIQQFKTGGLNVLVATSIGEEGLDIGQVDLIICYDASASPIRMLQRMGRTGRKRAGNIVLLLMRGKEQDNYQKAKDNYSHMQALICEGSRFDFRYDLSARIVPLDVYRNMEVEKRAVEIPMENSQNPALPEPPKSKRRRKPKMPPKKFHMPDNVETGFQRVSDLGQPGIKSTFSKSTPGPKAKKQEPVEADFVVTVPALHSVLLSKAEMYQFKNAYKDLPFDSGTAEDIEGPNLSAYPEHQRQLQKTSTVGHGSYTKRCVRMLRNLNKMSSPEKKFDKPYGEVDRSNWKSIPIPLFGSEEGDPNVEPLYASSWATLDGGAYVDSTRRQNTTANKRSFTMSFEQADGDEGIDDSNLPASPPPKKRGRPRRDAPAAARPVARRTPAIQTTKQAKAAAPKANTSKAKDAAALRRKATGQAKTKGKGKSKRGRVNDAREDYGDSCMRSDDLVVSSDGSDGGSDLEDFIVGDEVPSSQLKNDEIETSPTSQPPSSSLPFRNTNDRGVRKENRMNGYAAPEPLEDDDNDEEDYGFDSGDLPSLSQLAAGHKKTLGRSSLIARVGQKHMEDIDDESGDEPATRKKRFTVWDSDDDDYD